jgi:hypothetical protein
MSAAHPSSGIKRPGREADHSPRSSAEVKNGVAKSPLPLKVSVTRCLNIKPGDSFNFAFKLSVNLNVSRVDSLVCYIK